MATYVIPQVLVFQDLQISPVAVLNPLPALIAGGHAQLIRYSETDERLLGALGYYDGLVDTCYEWPNRSPGAIVDRDYVRIWMQKPLLQYFDDAIGGGSEIVKVAGSHNRIRSDAITFKSLPDYPRSNVLNDRDVQLGDVAKVRAIEDGDEYELWTYVAGFAGDPVAAVTGAAVSDVSNPATQILSASVVKSAGVDNCISPSVDASAYNGLAEGDINETYTVIVTGSSSGEDITTAKLRVISASGNDNQSEISPEAIGDPTPIGTRGLTLTFDLDEGAACSASASEDAVVPNDLIKGQTFTITVAQAFTKPVATSGGTYSGEQNTTLKIEVTRGGLYVDDELPLITISSTTGYDTSGPHEVAAAASAVAIGNYDVTIQFSGSGLRKGDIYYIPVTAATTGALRTLILGNNIDAAVLGNTEVELTLFISKDVIEIPANRVGFAPQKNWTINDAGTEVCLQDGAIAYDLTWAEDGELLPLPIVSEASQEYGRLFVEYRAWLPTLVGEVNSVDNTGDNLNIAIPGAAHPDNPLKWGVLQALNNANGTPVKYIAVADPVEEEDWLDVIEKLVGRTDTYGLVPLTRNKTVLDAFAGHADAMSSAEECLWRVLWVNLDGVPTKAIVTSENSADGEEVLAVLEDDPDTSGTQYTRLRVPAGNGDFLTNGVVAGDIIRTLFVGDGFGNASYSEFIVDRVISEDEVRLTAGHTAPISVAEKIEVHRNLSATEEADEIALAAGAWGNRRVRAVWPDTIENAGTTMEGYFLCAALAGLSSGILPHQGMTHLAVAGYTSVPRTTQRFNKTQLDAMAGSGTWIVTQTAQGEIFTRHAVTTGAYDNINEREEMITRNVDSISFRFKDALAPFIGVTNAVRSNLSKVRGVVESVIEVLKTESFRPNLGAQIEDATIIDLRRHRLLQDRFVLELSLTVPVALNNIETHLMF